MIASPLTRWAATTRRRPWSTGPWRPRGISTVQIALVGPDGGRRRRRWLSILTGRGLGLEIVDAPDVIAMTESPAAALRRKPARRFAWPPISSRRSAADALVSAGHTGATVMAAYGAFGMIPGVDRPALAASIPTLRAAGRAASMPAPTSSAGRITSCSSR